MNTMASGTACNVCNDDIEIYAVGKCNHPICFKCCTRMRLLCDQMYCAICRTDLTNVLFMRQVKKFDECVERFMSKKDSTLNIYFETDTIQAAFNTLIGHRCSLCSFLKPLKSFRELEQHMRREHNVHYCDICVCHLKIFSHERKCYDREKLGRHKRMGDADDKSHKGHPLCELCDQRYLDRDELARHCRKDHFYCHFCETDGRPLEFFDEYILLKEHFGGHHYLCEEGECYYVQHTNAFRSEIDIKAHRAVEHCKNMKKAEARQARTIEVDINLAPRHSAHGRGSRNGRGRGRHRDNRDYYDRSGDPRPSMEESEEDKERRRRHERQHREDIHTAQAVAQHLNQIHKTSGHVAVIDRSLLEAKSLEQVQQEQASNNNNDQKYCRRTEDFPILGGSQLQDATDSDDNRKPVDRSTLAKKLAHANHFSVQDGSMEDSDFPTLGGMATKGSRTVPKNQSAWMGQPVSSDFPSLPTRDNGPKKVKVNKVTKPVSTNYRQTNAKSNESWAESMSSSSGTVISSSKPTIQPAKGLSKADYPSLSSIGNSLLNHQPNAPGLSLTRSSTWAGGANGQSMEKQTFTKVRPAQFVGEDFPTLAGGSADNLNKWIPKPDRMTRSGNSGSRKQPAPMPDYFSSYSDSEVSWEAPKKSIRGEAKKSSKPDPAPDRVPQKKVEERRDEPENKKKKNKRIQGKKSPEESLHTSDSVVNKSEGRNRKEGQKSKSKVDFTKESKIEHKTSKVMTPTPVTNGHKGSPKEARRDQNAKDSPKVVKKNQAVNSPQSGKKNQKANSPRINKSEKISSSKTSKKDTKPDIQGSCVDAMTTVSMETTAALQPRVVTDNFPSLSELSEPGSISQSLSMSDFPVLTSSDSRAKSYNPPPPGFTAGSGVSPTVPHKTPPPGFSAPAAKPPPGFTTPAVDNIENVAPTYGDSRSYSYEQPPNFKYRNQQLILDITKSLSSGQFEKFKSCSGEFRQGKMSGAEYYQKCCDNMGKENFGKIFPELISLLPDIRKQQELVKAQSLDKSVIRISGKRDWKANAPFTSCITCQQVVLNTDLSDHSTHHSDDKEFPTLGSISASLATWGKK